jgi:hypothetical protein
MTLKIFCEDDSVQVINLHESFVLEKIGKRGITEVYELLTFSECNRKAMSLAQSVVGEELYKYHTLTGYDTVSEDARYRN